MYLNNFTKIALTSNLALHNSTSALEQSQNGISLSKINPTEANDPLLGHQWALLDTPVSSGLLKAQTITQGQGVIVGIWDSGFAAHRDIDADRVINFPESNSLCSGHGSNVAGTIAASRNNEIGIVGGAPLSSILPLAVTACKGSYETSTTYDDALNISTHIKSEKDQSYQKVDIINMSHSSNSQCSDYQDFIFRTMGNTTIAVASAGNDRSKRVNAPANCNDVISVGATNSRGKIASFSNYGPKIDIYAPGSQILTTNNKNNFEIQRGTSFSAPLVSATLALMKSINPNITSSDARRILQETAKPFDGCKKPLAGCNGLLDAYEAVAQTMRESGIETPKVKAYPNPPLKTPFTTQDILNVGKNSLWIAVGIVVIPANLHSIYKMLTNHHQQSYSQK